MSSVPARLIARLRARGSSPRLSHKIPGSQAQLQLRRRFATNAAVDKAKVELTLDDIDPELLAPLGVNEFVRDAIKKRARTSASTIEKVRRSKLYNVAHFCCASGI
jgi:hypothetical protein